MIGVVNQSTLATSAEAALWAHAIAHQLHYDVAPAWALRGGRASDVVAFASVEQVPHFAPFVVLLDDADQADALGYHDETPDGRPYGRVFLRPALDNKVDPSTVLSHEVVEMYGDLDCNRWAQAPDGTLWAVELCDPVEDASYPVAVGGQSVWLSDFVLPSFFDPDAAGSTLTSHVGARGPFSVKAGGYAIVMTGSGVRQIFGDDYPAWRRDTKTHPAARTARRGA